MTINMNLPLAFVLLLSAGGAGARACAAKPSGQAAQNKGAQGPKTPAKTEPAREEGKDAGLEIKTLAEGSYGRVEEAFIVVARDAEVYAALGRLAENLPPLGADFFRQNTVVAAFLGTRPTGGYAVELAAEGRDVLKVTERTPPRDAMTTQALTAPFKVVSVPVGDEQPLQVRLAGAWEGATRPYRVTRGDFKSVGGFAGRTQAFQLGGALRLMRHGNLATFFFDIESTGGKAVLALKNTATGVVGPGGSVTIPSTDAGTLVEQPRSPLRASGIFGAGENKLSLKFVSLPPRVSDGYGGEGGIEVEATAPPPKKNETLDVR